MSDSPENRTRCTVVGRFPPPIDGQTLATKRLSDLLTSSPTIGVVERIDTEPAGARVAEHAPRTTARFMHFVRLRSIMAARLRASTPDVILWGAVSPGLAGHVRDILCTLSAFPGASRVVAIVHRGNFEELFTRAITRYSGKRMVRRVDAFIFLSERLSERCATWIPAEKRHVVPNTVDSDVLFSESDVERARRIRASRPGIRALYLSNMIPSKGYEDVAVAVSLVDDPQVTATFAGDWQSEQERIRFQALIEKLGLVDRITVLGPVSRRSTVRQLYEEADVLVLPTYYPNEAQPLVLLEAMNAGLPVIVTAHGSIPEIVEEDRSGLFVSARAPAEIALALERLSNRETWLRLSHGARDRFDRMFSPDAVRRQWTDLVTGIGGRGS